MRSKSNAVEGEMRKLICLMVGHNHEYLGNLQWQCNRCGYITKPVSVSKHAVCFKEALTKQQRQEARIHFAKLYFGIR